MTLFSQQRVIAASEVAVAAVMLAMFAHSAGAARAQSPPPQTPPPTVVVEQVQQQPVGTIAEFVARVETIEAVDVWARVQGLLDAVEFSGGQHVEVGDILFRIEPEQYEAEVAAARAQAERAEATLTEAEVALARAEELRARGTVPQAALDEAIAAHAVAEADVAAARAAVRSAELNLGYTEIRAPIAGRIGRPFITRGNLVGPESGALARIVQLDPVRVVFSLSEGEVVTWRQAALELSPRADVARFAFTVRLPNGTPYAYAGALDFIESEVDPATGTIPVRAVFANPDNLLVPGQNVTLRAAEEDPPMFPVVRQSAVQQDRQGRYVYVLEDDNTVSRRDIETGDRVARGWAVESGLAAGETVVVQGVQRLRPGLQVSPSAAQEPRS
jgi:membrane fusion protein, multidrug efflux system